MSDSDVSGSDLDCSGLMNESDEVASTPITDKNSGGTSKTVTHVNFAKYSESDMQQLINARILDQLEKIGHRLDKIENKECKKTADKAKIKNSDNKGAKTKKDLQKYGMFVKKCILQNQINNLQWRMKRYCNLRLIRDYKNYRIWQSQVLFKKLNLNVVGQLMFW